MTILLLGAGPRFDWLRAWLQTQPPDRQVPVKVVAGPPTREELVALASESIDALVLVDHHAFAAGPPADGVFTAEAVRNEGLRAVFALELARRAVRTVALTDEPVEAWPATLATLAHLPPRCSIAPCPLAPAVSEAIDGTLARTYLQPLFTAQPGASQLVLAWPRDAFLDGDAPGSILPPAIEIAGRARILAYGPYLTLPAGQWRATVYLGFSVDIERIPFILEADTGNGISRGFFGVDSPGIFTLGLDFQVTNPLDPVELRLISQDSALDGQVALIEVQLEQSPA
jgi:hypothetical protein